MTLLLALLCPSAALAPPASGGLSSILLSSIAQLRREPSLPNRRAVLAAVDRAESLDGPTASVAGRWSLLFSTQESTSAFATGAPGPAQAIIDATYGTFFKFAPALAGAQADGATSAARNEQTIDLALGRVLNTVRIPLPLTSGSDGAALVLDVRGSVAPTADARVIAGHSS